jgi:hypothetical protein
MMNSDTGQLLIQAPVLKELTQSPDFMGVTLVVAKVDTEKLLERPLGSAAKHHRGFQK